MARTTCKLAAAAALTATALTLAACGTSSSSHVVQTPQTTVTPSPAFDLNSQTLDQINADLGSLDKGLAQVNDDIDHPVPDN